MAVVSGAGGGVLSVNASRGVASRSCLPLLDESYQLLLCGQVDSGMRLLVGGLGELRRTAGLEEWKAIYQPEALSHPVRNLVWQDPFTAHSYKKPRGYAGDAALLDYIYGHVPPPADTTALGREIFKFTCDSHAPRSVRARAQILAEMIDQAADVVNSPRILSIACGHLRELHRSKAMNEGRIRQFRALDQDARSLQHIANQFAEKGVETSLTSVRSILAEKATFRDLDLVYAAGLYDYLSDRVAARLTRLMFDMLVPGGRLLVANFTPRLGDIGYMETFMAWDLIYREAEQMTALAKDIASSEWASHRLFWDEHESIIFLEITKRRRVGISLSFGPGIESAAVPGLKHFRIGPAAAADEPSANGNGHPAGGNGNGNGRHDRSKKMDSPERSDGRAEP